MTNCIDNLDTKNIEKIGKILDINLHFNENPDVEKLKNILTIYKKYDDFMEILNFLNKTERKNINQFIFKIQKLVTNYINSNKLMNNFDFDKVQKETNEIKSIINYKKLKNYKKYGEVHSNFRVEIDMESANFTSLKIVSKEKINKDENWEMFLRKIVPYDIRSDNNKNKVNEIVGTVTPIPDCFYKSKFLRLMALSKFQKRLRIVWENEILKTLEKFCKLNLKNNFQFNSDEFLIDVTDFNEADRIISQLRPIPDYFRIKKYEIYPLNEYTIKYPNYNKILADYVKDHYYIRIYQNGTRNYDLHGINSYDRPYLKEFFDSIFQ